MSTNVPDDQACTPSYPRFEYLGGGYLRYAYLDAKGAERSAVLHRSLMGRIASFCKDSEGTIEMWNEEDGSLAVKLTF